MASDQATPLLVDVHWDGVVATVTVAGELDLTTAPGLTQRLLRVAARRPERLVLELGAVAFIDVSGARTIDAVSRALGDDCPVILRDLRPSARRALTLTGVISAGPAHAQRERAVMHTP
jgi:anti-anti-sigma factor